MNKAFFAALLSAVSFAQQETVPDWNAWSTQDPEVFQGGMGLPDNRAVFNLIDDTLIASGKAETEGAAPGGLSVEFYYKEVDDVWEFHGNMFFKTSWKKVDKNCDFSFWWSTSDDGSTMADGLHASIDGSQTYRAYDENDSKSLDYQEDFGGWVDSNLPVDGIASADDSQDMLLNPVKNRKTCDGNDCTWQAHWYRNYETGDANDIQFVEGIVDPYYIWGTYSCGDYTGSSNKFKVYMGHIYASEAPVEEVEEEEEEEVIDPEGSSAIKNLVYTASVAGIALFSLF